jgi:2-polyprenyl-6-methoxyphenol hydroxylase-like FAD-dependent oxidoreductase
MEAEAIDLLLDNDRVAGVRLADGEEVRARLTIAADGRRSLLRDKAAFPKRDLGAPIDVLWFRLPKGRSVVNMTGGTFGKGTLVVQLDRGDYWQCAYVVAKGGAEALKARGIEAFRRGVGEAAPELADVVDTLTEWDQVKLLSVTLDRLEQWSRPGLLAIGDAAHAMSPVGGVGINLAIQDAVAAANILAAPMARGEPVDALLSKVQERRLFPVRVVQAAQKAVHDKLLKPLIESKATIGKVPFVLRLFEWFPVLRRIPARLVGLGIRREHVRSPEVVKTD